MTKVFTAGLVALCLVVAGCSADSSEIGAEILDRSEAREQAGETEAEAADDATAESGFSVLASLEQIPLSAADDADSWLQVSMADVDLAADQARLRRPADTADADQLFEFIGPLTGSSPDGRPGRIFVPFPRVFIDRAIFQVDEFVDEVGFSPGDFNTFVALESPPAQFVVVSGVSARPGLPEVAPGVATIGEGDDFSTDGTQTSAARVLGRPLRVAERDGLVALSLATPPLGEWFQNGGVPTLADMPVFAAVAARLDEEAVVAATMFNSGGIPYEGVGVGWAAEDGLPRGVIVLSYESEAVAELQLPIIAGGFEGDSLATGQPMSELLTPTTIEVRGSEVVVNLTFPGDRDPAVLIQALIRQDIPFATPS